MSEQIDKLDPRVQKLLTEKGYSIEVSSQKGLDRSFELPDSVIFAISKVGINKHGFNEIDVIFTDKFRTNFEGETYDPFGDKSLTRLLDTWQGDCYQAQLRDLEFWKSRLEYAKANKFNSPDIHAIEDMISGLSVCNIQYKTGDFENKTREFWASKSVNIPLLEECSKDLKQISTEIKKIKTQSQCDSTREHQKGGEE